MNKIGIYYGYWTKDWIVDFSKYVDRAENLGFDIIEFDIGAVMDSPKDFQDKLLRKIKSTNIDVSFCVGLPKGYDISSGDSRERYRGIEYLKQAIIKTSEFEGKNLSGIIYGVWEDSIGPGEDKNIYVNRSIDSIKEVMDTAKQHNVLCNVEVVNRFEQFMLNTSKEALEYVNQVNHPNLKILLDTFHMNIEEDSFSEAISSVGKNLGQFHIGANNRKLPGEGHLDWEEITQALKDINFEGPIVMEPFISEGGDIAQNVKVWRDLDIKNKDLAAKKAKEFIKGLL